MKVEIDECGVYIYDTNGEEIVSWNTDEMNEDPESVCFAIAGSLKVLYEQNDYALKCLINHPSIR